MTLTRRAFLESTTATTAAVALSASAQATEREPGTKPNLLLILADQWRASALGIGSDDVVRTPHIDQLAQEGAHWTRAYAANPVCTPNRSCLLTGRYSHETGMLTNNLMLPPEEVCWPEIFRDANYATHYVGKWHLDGEAKPGFVPKGWRRRGFTSFEGFNRGHIYHRHWGFDDDGQPLAKKIKPSSDPYYEPTLQTDLAIDFMQRNQKQPFACYLSWGPPHTPFTPPDKFKTYAVEQIKHRPNVPPAHRARAARQLAGYYGLCESLDHELGRLMTYLKESGLADNTLVVFSSDHGELCGSHGKYRKGEPEEESLSVPLLMRMPGRIPAGRKIKTLINSIDLVPTMLRLCGQKPPTRCTGRDLSAVATGKEGSPRVDSVYCQGKLDSSQVPEAKKKQGQKTNTWRTVVTDRYKLTVRGDYDHVENLIDLQNDPYEMQNLANQPSSQALQEELMAKLKRHAKQTKDPFPFRPKAAQKMYSDEAAAAGRK